MNIELFPVIKVIPYARNPRRNLQSVDKVAASIKEFGFRQPIVVDNEMVIIAGHTRLLAAQKLGMDEVPVHIADNLTDAQKRAYRIADNRVSEDAEWDMDLLKIELSDLPDFDLDLIGFDADELKKILDGGNFEPGSIEDQGRLDELEPYFVDCPHCGRSFDAKA